MVASLRSPAPAPPPRIERRTVALFVSPEWATRLEPVLAALELRRLPATDTGAGLVSNADLLFVHAREVAGPGWNALRDRLARRPAPLVVAVGPCSSAESFRLGQAGIRALLGERDGPDAMRAAIERALAEPPELDALVSATVGHRPLLEIQRHVRRVMIEQALARARGSRSGAARLLHVSRQAVQQMVRELPD